MSISVIDFLKHIKTEIDFLLKHTENLSFESFSQNEVLPKACVRSLEIIGEASKKIPSEIRDKYPEMDWKGFAGLRDILIHHYWGVDYDILWDVLNDDIPFSSKLIAKIIDLEENIGY